MRLIKEISDDLGLPQSYLKSTARRASHLYKTYAIPKRSSGVRIIHHPARRLKTLQRWLVDRFILLWPVHDAVYSYRKGRSIKDNAQRHADSRYLLRLDIHDFFPSIKAEDIRSYISAGSSDWSPVDVDFFLSLVCRDDELTIGAPSSPALSNSVCYELDLQISRIARDHGVTYTRYADDLFLSCCAPHVLKSFPARVQGIFDGLAFPRGLQLHKRKTVHSSKKNRRQVTGVVLGSDGVVHLGRALKRTIRARIHKYSDLGESDRASLAGLLAYARSVDPDFINALILKYGHARVEEALRQTNQRN